MSLRTLSRSNHSLNLPIQKTSLIFLLVVLLFTLPACQAGQDELEGQSPSTELPPTTAVPVPTQTDRPPTATVPLPSRLTEIPPELEVILPPKLTWDFYPNGITREDLLARLPDAVRKSGHIWSDERWSGVIHITGDFQVNPGVTLTIDPGTLVLVAAGSDDQHNGYISEVDPFNPKDVVVDTSKQVEIQVQGNLYIHGTLADPVIFTSDSETPLDYDWDGLMLAEGSAAEISGAIIEFSRAFVIDSPEMILRKSILRNMQQSINMRMLRPDDKLEDLLGFNPVITENYIYNMGRIAVGITGSPEITHNVVIGRYDLESTGWEHGAIGNDIYTCPDIHHNYLEGGMPHPYEDSIYGDYYPFTQPSGAIIHGTCIQFAYNTVIGSPNAIESHPGSWTLSYNNIIPFPAQGAAEGYTYWHDESSDVCCLVLYDAQPEPNDKVQIEFIEKYGNVEIQDIFHAENNYWGTADPGLIEECMIDHAGIDHVSYVPFETEFIAEALPDWHQFAWK